MTSASPYSTRGAAFFLLFVFLILCTAGDRASATTVAPSFVKCPACGTEYVTIAYTSYNSWTMPKGPPAEIGVCPECLFAWKGAPPKPLSPEARAKAEKAVADFPNALAPEIRRKMRNSLVQGETSAQDALAAFCTARLRGAKWKSPTLPAKTASSPQEVRERRAWKSALPKLLAQLRQGDKVDWPARPPASGDPVRAALATNAELIEAGDATAAEFFVTWLIRAPMTELDDRDYSVCRSLAALPALRRPIPADLSQAKIPVVAEILHYLLRQSPASPAMARLLEARQWGVLSCMAAAACTGRADRTVVDSLHRKLTQAPDIVADDYLEAYFRRVGSPADAPALQRYAREFTKLSRKPDYDWVGLIRKDFEGAVVAIKLRSLLAAR